MDSYAINQILLSFTKKNYALIRRSYLHKNVKIEVRMRKNGPK